MLKSRGALVVLALACTPAAAADLPVTPPPLEAYGKLPKIESAQISPDGALIALVVTDGEARNVAVENADDGKIIGGLRAGNGKLRDIAWAGSDHLLVTFSATAQVIDLEGPKREWLMTLDYNVKTRRQRPLMENVDQSMNVVLGAPQVRIIGGQPIAFVPGVQFVNNIGRNSLYRTNLNTGVTSLAREGQDHTEDWLVDAAGQPLAETEFDADAGKWTLKVHRAGGWKTVMTSADKIGGPDMAGLGRDGHSMLFSQRGDELDELHELAVDSDAWGEPIATGAVTGPIFDTTGTLIGLCGLVGDTTTYRFFKPADQMIWTAVTKAYPGAQVSLASWSDNHRRMIVMVDSPTEGPAYAFVDLDTHKGIWLGDIYKEASAQMSPVTPVSFKAKDGTALTGYLTVPRGKAAKDLPLVVFPHGGPAARDTPGFDWWAQAMASRGYAVLQVNYRGSDGFGWGFLSAGFGEWGRKMQTDLSDGVRYLAAQGAIDPKRVCIVGASYGGYAALAGAALDTGVYRCAVSVAGPSEMGRFASWSRNQYDVSAQRYWLRFLGADRNSDASLAEVSPADHADKVTIPVLLIHGKDDTVVPFSQTQLMADALAKAGKPYELVVLKHEDHWLSHGDTRLQMLQAVVAFLQKNNPPS